MARNPGVFVEPHLQRIVKLYCAEKRFPQTTLAEALELSYPTLNRAINKKKVDPATKNRVEEWALRIGALHPEIVDLAMDPLTEKAPAHIVAQRLRDYFTLKDDDQALRIARSLLKGMHVFV